MRLRCSRNLWPMFGRCQKAKGSSNGDIHWLESPPILGVRFPDQWPVLRDGFPLSRHLDMALTNQRWRRLGSEVVTVE